MSHPPTLSPHEITQLLEDWSNGNYAKRGAGAQKISLDETAVLARDRATELLLLDEALHSLAEIDPRRSRVVELRFFGGLDNDEIAAVLKISANTVTRDWNLARAWLYQELSWSVT